MKSHNKAIYELQKENLNLWMSLTEISEYTERHCRSRCYPVHSRIADIRKKARLEGYQLENDATRRRNGVVVSKYRLSKLKSTAGQ